MTQEHFAKHCKRLCRHNCAETWQHSHKKDCRKMARSRLKRKRDRETEEINDVQNIIFGGKEK